MKMLMPKEMKIRLVANVLGIVFAFLSAGYAIWFLIAAVDAGAMAIVFSVLCVAAACVYFLMAKIMWALKKQTKMLGWVVLMAFGALGISGSIMIFIPSLLETSIDYTPAVGWSFGVGLLSGGSAFLIVVGKLVGEMVEKLKVLMYVGIGCIAGLVVLLIVFGTGIEVDEAHLFSAGLGAFYSTVGGIVVTILGYWAEAVLIKKKFLVYN